MPVTEAVGWALLHSLWQDALAAVGLASLFVIVPARCARARYALATATLGLMIALPLTTGVWLHGNSPSRSTESGASALAPAPALPRPALQSPAPASEPVAARPHSGVAPALPGPSLAARVSDEVEPALPWVVVLWLAGVLAMSLRLTSGWLAVRRLWKAGTHPVPPDCGKALERLARRLRVTRPVRVLQSALVQVPAVVGWLRPAILLPASALTGLTPLQLDALLAHELAHVRRYDYLVNLLQSAVEALLFYHPAAWWVSRRVRDEREHCCDDLAVAACGGDAQFYAMALLGMEQLRIAGPPLALAAGGGSLIGRVQRLVVPAQVETFPRWVAGLVVVALAATIAAGTGVTERAEALHAVSPLSPGSLAVDATRTGPDTVLRYAGPAQTLAARWDWASIQARRLGAQHFWVGYSVHRRATSEDTTSPDRDRDVTHTDDAGFRGVRLAPLVGVREDSDDIALLLRFTVRDGRPVPARARVSSLALPVDFGGGALLWLGGADDGASLRWMQVLFAEAGSSDLKQSLIAAVGLHASTGAVVPTLERWLQSEEHASVRAEAAEWLGHQPDSRAVSALAWAVRSDAVGHVRREATEALGDNPSAAATDSLIALARTLHDADARRAAVDQLGRKSDPRAVAALVAIARNDADEDVQDQAIKALGSVPDAAARAAALVELARTHSSPDSRRQAVETVGKSLPGSLAVPALGAIAREDPDVRVQREAVKALGSQRDRRAFALLVHLARHHPASRVRREAVEQLGEMGEPDSAAAVLEELALNGSDDDLQREAVETLSRLPDARGRAWLARLARSHPSDDVRREAVEEYAEVAPPETALVLLTDRLANDQSPEVQAKALRRLAGLPDGIGIPALIECARTHPNHELRREARRLLHRHDDRS